MTILLIILFIIAIPLVKALFIPVEYSIERETDINKPVRTVFDYLRILKNAEQYNKWVMTDPAMKKTYQGTDGTVGFIYGWDSDNKQVGKGEQEIKNISEGKRIDYEIRFFRPFQGVSSAWLETMGISENKTHVKWVFAGNRTYMMRVMHVVLNLKNALGKDLQTSLNNLKTVLEK